MSSPPLLLVDLGDVLADYRLAVCAAMRARGAPEHLSPPAELHAALRSVYRAEGFFRDLPPIPGALEAVREMLAEGIDVRICTAPVSTGHCLAEKFEWVERYLGREAARKMILAKDKTLVRGDVLIDDAPAITGARAPEWRHIVFDQTYNRRTPPGPRSIGWANWRAVLSPLLEQARAG